MRKALGLLILVATALPACASESSDDGEETTDATSSAIVASIAGTSFTPVNGYQTNSAILGVPVRAFWTNGQAEAWVNLPSGGNHGVVFDMAITECQGQQMGVSASFVGADAISGAGGFTPNSRIHVRLTVKAPAAGWQRLRIGADGDHAVPNVCDANLYVFNVTVS